MQLIDEAPDGSRTYLQRGLLKASHKAIDATKSDYRNGRMYRPWRPHTNPQLVTPGAVNEYLVEVFPVGHVLRTGHRLMVKISAPPVIDSFYAYVPKVAPTVNTLHHTVAQAQPHLAAARAAVGRGARPGARRAAASKRCAASRADPIS